MLHLSLVVLVIFPVDLVVFLNTIFDCSLLHWNFPLFFLRKDAAFITCRLSCSTCRLNCFTSRLCYILFLNTIADCNLLPGTLLFEERCGINYLSI